MRLLIFIAVLLFPLVSQAEEKSGDSSFEFCGQSFSSPNEMYSKIVDNSDAGAKKEDDYYIHVYADKIWTFTKQTHPAHPTAICRAVLEKGGEIHIKMSVMCGSTKEQCDRLTEEFAKHNEKIMENSKKK